MSITKYIDRLKRIDALILQKATGTPTEFAHKLGLRRSTLYQTLQEINKLGVKIKYSNARQSYYYAGDRRIIINFENVLTEESVLEEIQ
jgi:DNA-binding IclR family transcriptional regulator